MESGLAAALKSVPPEEWERKQVIALDWYDGPTMGLCELERPRCAFRFDILGQRFDSEWADRLFRLGEVPLDAVERAIAALADLGPPKSPDWSPIWRYSSEDAEREARRAIDKILASAMPTPIILRAMNMECFLAYWYDVSDIQDAEGGVAADRQSR